MEQAGLPVYAFNGTTYTNFHQTTDASGQAIFTLPTGAYRFRADLNGTQFWSGASNHCTVPGCTSAVVTTTQPLTVTVVDTSGGIQAGLPVYVFDGTSYTSYNKSTDANGQAVFTLPEGNYHFRSEKNGTQFWSEAANHCALPGCAGATVTTTVPLTVTVLDTSGAPQGSQSTPSTGRPIQDLCPQPLADSFQWVYLYSRYIQERGVCSPKFKNGETV